LCTRPSVIGAKELSRHSQPTEDRN
jgi:hypothetical protein